MEKKIILVSAILTDAILINAAVCLGFLTKFHGIPAKPDIILYLYFFPLFTLIQIITFAIFQLYKLDQDQYPFDICYHGFWAVTINWLLAFLIILITRTYFFTTANISRELVLYNWGWTFILTAGWRIIYYRIERNRGAFISRVVIVGSGRIGKEIMNELSEYSRFGHQVLGLIDTENISNERETTLPVLGKMSEVKKLVQQFGIMEIIIAVSSAAPAELLRIVSLCEESGARIKILPSLYEVTVGRITLQETAGIPLIEVKANPFVGVYPFVKRMMDIGLAIFCLFILLPLFLLISVAIKIASPGPVLYRQQRVGKDGKVFILYKFRTMVPNAEAITGPILATANDPRVTRVGTLLRKIRIDELPQLLNVLKGDMSLVGPRPERPEFVAEFSKTNPSYNLRLKVQPGLTGLAQIYGRYDSSVENKLRFDLAYVYNIRLMVDLKILFSTLRVVLSGKGAK